MDWASFLKAHNLQHSMSRRATATTMLWSRASSTCSSANASGDGPQDTRRSQAGCVDYIEMFYNPVRKHVRNQMLSPVKFERQQNMSTKGA